MKRALLALATIAALAAANGCGWQTQNLQGNYCTDGVGCAACGHAGGRFGHGGIGNGQLANRIRAGAYSGPPHVEGDFLTGLQAWRQSRRAGDAGGVPGYDGASPTVTYPYYTTRGPRDFLLNDPMPLGY